MIKKSIHICLGWMIYLCLMVTVVKPSGEPGAWKIHAGGWSVLASMHSQPIYDGAFSISHMMIRSRNDAESIDFSYIYAVFLPDNNFMVNVEGVIYSTVRLKAGHRSISLPFVKYVLMEGGTHYLSMNLPAKPTSPSHFHFAVGSYLPLVKELALSQSRKIVLQLNLYLSGLPVSVGFKPAILTADIMVHGQASLRYGRYVLSLDSSARQGIILIARTEQRWIRHIRPLQVTLGYQFGS